MTQACCLTCQHWKRQRVADNWGICQRIEPVNSLIGESHAYFTPTQEKVQLVTRDVFYCEQFTQRKIERYTIVDAAREAIANFKERSKT